MLWHYLIPVDYKLNGDFMKFIKKSIVLLIFSILSGYSSIYSMEEEEAKTSVEIAQQLEQAFIQQDQAQFEAILASITAVDSSFIEQLDRIIEIIQSVENGDLITNLCSTIITAITQQEQNNEIYQDVLKRMVSVVDFLITGLTQEHKSSLQKHKIN